MLEHLDAVEIKGRNADAPLRIPILEAYRDSGTYIMGKIEAGTVRVGDTVTLMPNATNVKVVEVQIKDECVAGARPGENVRLKVTNVAATDVSKGFVLCAKGNTTPVVKKFECSMVRVDGCRWVIYLL
jgi:peptide chain release factor subunit 3